MIPLRVLLSGLVFLAIAPPVMALTLAGPGQTPLPIVLGDAPSLPEQHAASELAQYLGQVTGRAFTASAESSLPEAPGRIYVGSTAFAKAQGLDVAALGPEEWVFRVTDHDVVIAGGRPRGTLYAVYHFLEDVVGVHWWNPFEEGVPNTPTLNVPALERRGKPVLRYRDIYMLYGGDRGRFAARNRLNRDGDAGIAADYGGEMGYGPPYHVHTFYTYFPPEKYFGEHPEWFSMIDGKRNAEQAQLCLTNPELRAAFLEKLKAYIEQARADAEKAGQPAPTVFDVSQNDWGGMCQCPACQAIATAEESESGPLLDFLNWLVDAIKEPYPGVYIDSLAYMMTQKPPKSIHPRDNLILRLCDTGSNFTRPITDQENVQFREHLLSWARIAKNLRLWNYAVTYAPFYGLPLPTVQTYPVNYQFFAEHNVEGVFTEHEYPVLADMRDFKIWMMMKMLEDPYQDYGALVRTFTDGFYGPAGEHVRAYLACLEKAAEAKPSYLSMGASPRQYHYLDLAFIREAQGLFDQAEAAVKDDSALLRRVRYARLPLDRASLVKYRDLTSAWAGSGQDPQQFPLDLDAIGKRCRDTWYAQIDFRLPAGQREAARAEADAELNPLLVRPVFPPLPEAFRGLPPGTVIDYTADLTRNWQDEAKRVPDAEAESGLSNRLVLSGGEGQKYALPMPWGLYDVIHARGVANAVIHAEDVAGPGYHWYKMGAFPIGSSYYVYFFWSWNIQLDLDNSVDAQHPDQRFEIWARIKFEGPMFPHGKPDAENAISIERVILKKAS